MVSHVRGHHAPRRSTKTARLQGKKVGTENVITITNRYTKASKTTKSVNVATIRRIANKLSNGSGTVTIRNEGGDELDLVDRGYGVELLNCTTGRAVTK